MLAPSQAKGSPQPLEAVQKKAAHGASQAKALAPGAAVQLLPSLDDAKEAVDDAKEAAGAALLQYLVDRIEGAAEGSEERLDAIQELGYALAAGGVAMGSGLAGKLMYAWLRGNTPYELSKDQFDWCANFPEVQAAELASMARGVAPENGAQDLLEQEQLVRFSHESLYWAMNSATLSASGSFADGVMTVTFRLFDKYDWHDKGQGTTIFGVEIKDGWFIELQDARGLTAVEVTCEWTESHRLEDVAT